MKKDEIKRIMIIHNDNDFVRVWDWIGKVSLMTILNDNICGCRVLEDSEDIEKFIHSLLPTAIEFLQYKEDKYAKYCRYRDISKEDIDFYVKCFEKIKFKYNFDEINYDFGVSEALIIDLEKNESYIL